MDIVGRLGSKDFCLIKIKFQCVLLTTKKSIAVLNKLLNEKSLNPTAHRHRLPFIFKKKYFFLKWNDV